MEVPIAILILAAFVTWTFAELRGGRVARFATGGAAMLAAYFAGQFTASVIPSYERRVTRASMSRFAELLDSGQTDRLRNAIEIYNTHAQQGSTYTAALKTWDAVSQKQDNAKLP
jgi:hypothetical protein